MYAASLFNNCWDKQPQTRAFDSWNDLVGYLRDQSQIAERIGDWEKKRTPLISPAIYPDGAQRAKESVALWGNWFAADVDNKEGLNPLADIATMAEKCEAMGCAYALYTTTSSHPERQCFRLLFPTNRAIEPAEFADVWHAVAQWLGAIDAQTKDESRMFTLPRAWDGGHNVFHSADGATVDLDALKASFPRPVAPEARERRTRLLEALNVSEGLKPVCPTMVSLYGPFVTDKARSEAMTGEKGGRMFRFLCSVASVAILKGFDISADHLADIGDELARALGRHVDDIDHDARNALRKAQQSFRDNQTQQFTRSFRPFNNKFLR